LFVCLYVCMFVFYTNPRFWTHRKQTLHTSTAWSGRERRVCMGPKFFTSSTFGDLFLWGTLQNHGHKMAAGVTLFRDTLISVVPAVFAWRHWHYVVAGGGVIRGSLISVILAGVPLTSRKLHRSRWQGHPPQRRIPYSGGCSRHVTDSTFHRATGPFATALHPSFQFLFCGLHKIKSWQTTVARSYSNCIALSVMRTIRWDVNGIHVSTIWNLIRREEVTKELQLYK
jgi:hypothetical protein